jgi:CPSF A subunit region
MLTRICILHVFLHISLYHVHDYYLQQERPTLCGREHQSYRSYYLPVRAVIDGELCELFNTLPHDTQKKVRIIIHILHTCISIYMTNRHYKFQCYADSYARSEATSTWLFIMNKL